MHVKEPNDCLLPEPVQENAVIIIRQKYKQDTSIEFGKSIYDMTYVLYFYSHSLIPVLGINI